jgi:hypothetical protein
MSSNLINSSLENIQDAVQHPKGWLGICTLFFIIDQYVFSQWSFGLNFFMLFILDTLVGVYVAFRMERFSFTKFRRKLMDKSLAYFTIIISYSIATKIVLDDGSESIISYLNIPFYSLFVTVELASIIKNWYTYKQWPFLLKIIKHFEIDLDDKP